MRLSIVYFLLLGMTAYAEQSSIYSPVGKRDPFKAPELVGREGRAIANLSPQERFPIEQLQLKAILQGTRPQAMIQDPDGNVFIVSEGEVLGREKGTISRILNREIIVTERTTNYLGREALFERVLSLPGDEEVGQVEQDNRVTVPPPSSFRTVPGNSGL